MTFKPSRPIDFDQNAAAMAEKVKRLRMLESRAASASETRRIRMEARGQITPRARLARLLDPGMPFLQLHTLAGYLTDTDDPENSVPGASILVGIGFVSGVRAMIWVDDSGIKAGAIQEMTLPAILSIQEMALRQKLPLIHLVESAGANLMDYRVEGWAKGGALFANLAKLSAAGIPVISVLHGPSTAGGAYMPGLSDYVIGVKKNGLAALAGAALVHAATGEVADDRSLGGAEMHATQSGLVEYLAEDDTHAIALAREVVTRLDWTKHSANAPSFQENLYSSEELAGIVPLNISTPYDARELVARLVDGSDFSDFKPDYGAATLCLQASIHGNPVCLLANNGPIDPDGATKATQFIQLADQTQIPLIFLNNTTGYMVGSVSEQAGMIKHGSKMIQAVTNTRCPKIALYVGASFGAGNYGMSGYAYEPDFLFAWPNAQTGVMGGAQAAGTMSMVARASAKRKNIDVDEAKLGAQERRITEHFDGQSDAFYTSGRVLDHGVIDPVDTRRVLAFCLETIKEGRARRLNANSFGIGRM